MTNHGSRAARWRLTVIAVLTAVLLAFTPGTGWADPTAEPSPGQSQQTSAGTDATSETGKSKAGKSKTKPKKATKASKKAAKKTKAKSKKRSKATPKPGPTTKPKVGAQGPQAAGDDLSTVMPHALRDQITGDFLDRGYDQWMRAEGAALNIYDSPSRGSGLLQSVPLDLSTPNGTQWSMWAPYGNFDNQQCATCFQALDNAWHLATILLAYDEADGILWITGTKGTYLGGDPDRYRNILYGVAPDGSCASESCAGIVIDLPAEWQDANGIYFRAVGATALEATNVNGIATVAVGLSDYGVQVYQPGPVENPAWALAGSYTSMGINGMDQTPTTAMALDQSGLLVMGISNYGNDGYFAQITNGTHGTTITDLGRWTKQGATDSNGGTWINPISAAIGQRPDGSKVAVFGLTDGKLYVTTTTPPPNTGSNAVTLVATSPSLGGGITAITPLPRLDGTGTTDYATAVQGANIGVGTGLFLTDPGGSGATLLRQPIGIDANNNELYALPCWCDFQTWFPGYKQGRFTIQNTLSEPISVQLQTSEDSEQGCWFAPAWPETFDQDASAEFPTSSAVTVAAGQTTGLYTMGAYTSGPDAGCSGVAASTGSPSEDPSAAWRAYLVITPVNRPAETRMVNLHLNPDGWTVDVSDQQGGSLTVTPTNINSTLQGQVPIFGAWQLAVSDPGAPTATGTAPTLTGYQLTPTGTAAAPTVYRLDVGPTTWTVPGLSSSGANKRAQALLPPLQIQGRTDSTAAWVNVGQLIPPGALNVSGSTLTVPGASFYWENVQGGPTYTQFQVLTGGADGLTSPTVDLTTLAFCYTGVKPGGPCQTTVPSITGLGFSGSSSSSPKVVANGLDQALLSPTLTPRSGTITSNDDAYNKIFYRQSSSTGPLVTNLYRQDVTCSDCYSGFVGVQPSAGAYLNTGGSYGAKRGLRDAGTPADYVSTTGSGSQSPTIAGMIRLSGTSSNTMTITGYTLAIGAATSSDLTDGFQLSGCAGEGNSSGTCTIAPTSTARAALYAVGGPYANTATDTGLRIGALFSNQAQNAVEDLPLTWQNTAPKLDQPAALTGINSNYLWKLLSAKALHTAHGDTWVITHGTLVSQTMCVNSSCNSS